MFIQKQTSIHSIDGKKYKVINASSGKYLMAQRKNGKWYSQSTTTPKGKKIFNEIYFNRKGYNELK